MVQLLQDLADEFADFAQGMVRGESASQDECTKTSRLDPEIVRASTVLPPNQGRTESPLFRSGEVFQQTARAMQQESTRDADIVVKDDH